MKELLKCDKKSLVPKSMENIKAALNQLQQKRENFQILQVAFLFDTTGSMYPYFKQGQQSIYRIVKKVAERHKDALFSYIAYKNHGDELYFDGVYPFYASDFTSIPSKIDKEMAKIQNGGGGDGLTALEDVLHYLNVSTQWHPLATKVIVLIGDMPPHGVLDSKDGCIHGYAYDQEVKNLAAKKIKIYSVFCCEEEAYLSSRKQKVLSFFKWIAKECGGYFLQLAEIDDLVDLLIGICMKETGHLSDFINELKVTGILSHSKAKLLLPLNTDKK